jgi:hypothetical protein
MKSKMTPIVFLIFLSCFIFQKSNSQSLTSVKHNYDSLLFDAGSIKHSPCNGTVSAIRGCAKIIKPSGECGVPGSSSNASVGDGIGSGDKIQVCGNSMIEVTLSDGSVMRGAPNSEIDISQMDCSGERSFSLRLTLGGMWSHVAQYIGGDSKFEVQTENAVTGVRGTKYFVKVARDTVFDNPERSVWTVNTTTTVVCLEGIVDVSNANGITLTDTLTQVRLYEDFQAGRISMEEFQRRVTEMNSNNKVTLTAGMETTVYAGNPPMPPRRTRMTEADFSQENMLNR